MSPFRRMSEDSCEDKGANFSIFLTRQNSSMLPVWLAVDPVVRRYGVGDGYLGIDSI